MRLIRRASVWKFFLAKFCTPSCNTVTKDMQHSSKVPAGICRVTSHKGEHETCQLAVEHFSVTHVTNYFCARNLSCQRFLQTTLFSRFFETIFSSATNKKVPLQWHKIICCSPYLTLSLPGFFPGLLLTCCHIFWGCWVSRHFMLAMHYDIVRDASTR